MRLERPEALRITGVDDSPKQKNVTIRNRNINHLLLQAR